MTPGPIVDHEALRHLQTVVVLAFIAAAVLSVVGLIALASPYPAAVPWLLAASALVLGIGLKKRSRVARVAAIVWSALWVPIFPVGTAFGLYTLWVLRSRRVTPFFAGQAPTTKAKAFAAIVTAQVSLAGCAVWALIVLTQLAWPMLAKAHLAQREAQIADMEQSR